MKTFLVSVVAVLALATGFTLWNNKGTNVTPANSPVSTTSTLSVAPNYGEQKTAPSTVLQNAPNTVQNTADGSELQNANVCLQGC